MKFLLFDGFGIKGSGVSYHKSEVADQLESDKD